MTPEGKLQQKIIQFLEQHDILVRAVQWRGRKDCPDIVIIGQPDIWIEVKCPGEKPRPSQEREHEKMRAAGAIVEVAQSVLEVDAIINRYGVGD